MPVTPIFANNYSSSTEQNLIEDLVVESIKHNGVDMQYITRQLTAVDDILREDDLSIFNGAYEIEMYVKSVDGFEGEGEFLSKFGLQIRDTATFVVSLRSFAQYVTSAVPVITRPREGDLVYFPIDRKIYKIMNVNHQIIFYQLGAIQSYELSVELFEYSNERFQTGNSTIDNLFAYAETSNTSSLSDLETVDPIAQNFLFEKEAETIIDISETNPFFETITFPTDE